MSTMAWGISFLERAPAMLEALELAEESCQRPTARMPWACYDKPALTIA